MIFIFTITGMRFDYCENQHLCSFFRTDHDPPYRGDLYTLTPVRFSYSTFTSTNKDIV